VTLCTYTRLPKSKDGKTENVVGFLGWGSEALSTSCGVGNDIGFPAFSVLRMGSRGIFILIKISFPNVSVTYESASISLMFQKCSPMIMLYIRLYVGESCRIVSCGAEALTDVAIVTSLLTTSMLPTSNAYEASDEQRSALIAAHRSSLQ